MPLYSFKKVLLFILPSFILLCCNRETKQRQVSSNKSKLTVNLPFESSNYEKDTGFVLYDSTGKICIPVLDTITKGGGTVSYENLANGMYSYRLVGLFNDTMRRQFRIDSSFYLNFYQDCYAIVDSIEQAVFNDAGMIDVQLSSEKSYQLLQLRKTVAGYDLLVNGKPHRLKADKSKLVQVLVQLQSTARELNGSEDNHGYSAINAIYIKCDNTFTEFTDIRQRDFEALVKRFLYETGKLY